MSKKNEGYRGATGVGGDTGLFERPKHLRAVRVEESRLESEGAAADESRELGARKLEKSI